MIKREVEREQNKQENEINFKRKEKKDDGLKWDKSNQEGKSANYRI